MRIGLVSYRCENRNIDFNMKQIELAMQRMKGELDLLCFGEAFLQGFDALCWNYESDKAIALELSSEMISQLRTLTIKYGISLITGYIEKDEGKLYSSCVVIADGDIVHNYRRISKGWKEYSKTDGHYCEGNVTGSFYLQGKEMTLALCGDLWEFPDRFRTDRLLIWPVYCSRQSTTSIGAMHRMGVGECLCLLVPNIFLYNGQAVFTDSRNKVAVAPE